jgi:hypothetical protein
LAEKNYPTDPKVVDDIVNKHLEERSSHIEAYEKEFTEDILQEIKKTKEKRLRENEPGQEITDHQIDRYIRSKNQELAETRRQHNEDCERENQEIKSQIAHYKKTHCNENSNPESSSNIDFVLEKQNQSMPDIADSDGGGD